MILKIANKLHFFTLLLVLAAAAHTNAAEDYASKQKIKESDIIKASVPVSSDNKFQHQNKRGVSDISEDIVLGSAHPGSSSYLSPNTLSGFSPIAAPYSSLPYHHSSGHQLGPIYAAPFYAKPIASYPAFKAPFTATYPANGISYGSLPAFPKLSYANSYNGYPTASYATASHHHNAIAYPSIQYPTYQNAAPIAHGSYYPQPAHSSVTHHGVYAQAPASPVIYGNGIHKYGLAAPAVYAASDVYHQPQFAYAAVQPAYHQASVLKQPVYAGPTVPTATIKPVTQHSQAGGAVSFASFSQHTGTKGPIYGAVASAPVAAVAPQYAAVSHQYAPQQYIVSGGYKVAAASQPAPVYAQIPYSSGAVQYGSHLVPAEPAKVAYQQVTHHK
ncbi:uncharacterized protein LOC134837645 [Culicoides brevitarsis]|uniref:uncharacterized protein LOC134837645 n=1 Tax=Culicoides brevitarsis TaxID=469753 RepID=UPI00307C3984